MFERRSSTDGAAEDSEHFLPVSGFSSCLSLALADILYPQAVNRKAPARLDLKDVFHAVVQVLDTEAVAAAGNLNPPAKRKKRRRHRLAGENGQTETQTLASPSQTQPQTQAEEEMPT